MTVQDPEDRSRGLTVDMSADAIARRLEILGELDELARLLETARRASSGAQVRERGPSSRTGRVDDRAAGDR